MPRSALEKQNHPSLTQYVSFVMLYGDFELLKFRHLVSMIEKTGTRPEIPSQQITLTDSGQRSIYLWQSDILKPSTDSLQRLIPSHHAT